jgi:hypothetical protein
MPDPLDLPTLQKINAELRKAQRATAVRAGLVPPATIAEVALAAQGTADMRAAGVRTRRDRRRLRSEWLATETEAVFTRHGLTAPDRKPPTEGTPR